MEFNSDLIAILLGIGGKNKKIGGMSTLKSKKIDFKMEFNSDLVAILLGVGEKIKKIGCVSSPQSKKLTSKRSLIVI